MQKRTYKHAAKPAHSITVASWDDISPPMSPPVHVPASAHAPAPQPKKAAARPKPPAEQQAAAPVHVTAPHQKPPAERRARPKPPAEQQAAASILHPASAEQQAIVAELAAGHNVMCNAVAGSGKTTTVLHIAAANPDKHVLQLTYNKALAAEVRNRAATGCLDNLEVRTFHAAAVFYFNADELYTDAGLLNLTYYTEMRRTPNFDIVVIDEAQDITPAIYGMLKVLLSHLQRAQIVVMGDTQQGVYAFSGTDTRFLTAAPELFSSPHRWASCCLSTTYRCTREIADFINNYLCYSGEAAAVARGDAVRQLVAVKSGPKVQYYRGAAYAAAVYIGKKLASDIAAGICAPSDIFVLGRTVRKSGSAISKLENVLVEAKIPCYAPISDDSRANDEIMAGKVVLSSFHQSKGRERPIVVCFDFDAFYYQNAVTCPPELFVGASRSSCELHIVQGVDTLPFMREVVPTESINVREFGQLGKLKPRKPQPKTVTKLLRFLRPELLVELDLDAHFVMLRGPGASVRSAGADTSITNTAYTHQAAGISGWKSLGHGAVVGNNDDDWVVVPSMLPAAALGNAAALAAANTCIGANTCTGKPNEETADLIGMAVPAIMEHRTTGRCTLLTQIEEYRRQAAQPGTTLHNPVAILRLCANLPPRAERTDQALRIANIHTAITSGLHHRVSQMQSYNWLNQDDAELYLETLQRELGFGGAAELPKLEYEIPLRAHFGDVTIDGRADLLVQRPHEQIMYELKCTSSIGPEHKLQLLFYAALYECQSRVAAAPPRRYRLLNMLSGELWEYTYNRQYAHATVDRILAMEQPQLSHAEFVHMLRDYPRDPIYNNAVLERLKTSELRAVASSIGMDQTVVDEQSDDEIVRAIQQFSLL